MTGIIYAPDASLSVTGGASIASANSNQTFAMIINTLSATGGTKILPTLAAGSQLGTVSTTSTMLVN
jgi:hypothetical protein